MHKLYIPEGYRSALTLRETEIAIKKVKDFFERDLATELNLTRVSAPVFVERQSGLNDDLNGVERAVSFDLRSGEEFEIVHSLAKWKRAALAIYDFEAGEGLYTDMSAIRRDEDLVLGTPVTLFSLSPFSGSPFIIRSLSAAISSGVLRIGTAWQRQCGCQPVNLKSLGYLPFSVSQMSVSGTPLSVWLLDNLTSMPTTKSSCCQRT